MKSALAFLKSNIGRIITAVVFFIPAFILEQFDLAAISIPLYIAAIILSGGKVFCGAARGILRGDLLDERFLMSIASIGAMLLGEWSEGAAVMLFYLVGETFENIATRRSRSSIKALMDICPDEATLITDEGEMTVFADEVAPGSRIIIRPGERVPIDCVIISGSADVDTSSMTGEAVPIGVGIGDTLDSGVVVLNGLITAKTIRMADESAASRVLSLVEDANENKSRVENFITKFSHYYTPAVVICAVLIAFIPPVFSLMSWGRAIYTALTFLVISCPCALVISVPMAFFGGIGGAASRGILYKGGNVFSKVAKIETVAFDKTGTVTGGDFKISGVYPIGVSRQELLSLAAAAEYASNHPIARCIKNSCDALAVPDIAEEIAGKGIIATIAGRCVSVGNRALMEHVGAEIPSGTVGTVFVADGRVFLGSIEVTDELRPEAKEAIRLLRSVGVKKIALLSGDKHQAVQRVGESLGIDLICSELKPEDKYKRLEELILASGSVAYVGDGINDAPALALSDVGIAMGGVGQDSAIEVADMVIVTDNLTKIYEAVLIARKTVAIAKENIIFALGVKGLIMLLGVLGFANMWLAVFADVGVAVLAILNSMRALRFSKRHIK